MYRLINRKGQSTLEYAILVVVVIMALIGAQAYIKRAISGRMKESSDDIGEQYSFYGTQSNWVTATHSIINEQADAYATNRNYKAYSSSRTGNETILNMDTEYAP